MKDGERRREGREREGERGWREKERGEGEGREECSLQLGNVNFSFSICRALIRFEKLTFRRRVVVMIMSIRWLS